MMMAEIAMRANAILPYTTMLEKISANWLETPTRRPEMPMLDSTWQRGSRLIFQPEMKDQEAPIMQDAEVKLMLSGITCIYM